MTPPHQTPMLWENSHAFPVLSVGNNAVTKHEQHPLGHDLPYYSILFFISWSILNRSWSRPWKTCLCIMDTWPFFGTCFFWLNTSCGWMLWRRVLSSGLEGCRIFWPKPQSKCRRKDWRGNPWCLHKSSSAVGHHTVWPLVVDISVFSQVSGAMNSYTVVFTGFQKKRKVLHVAILICVCGTGRKLFYC